MEKEKIKTSLAWGWGKEVLASMSLFHKLTILVLITFITRYLAFFQLKMITNDGVLYIQMAKLFSEGKFEGIPGTYFNLYPLLIFLVHKITGDWEFSGQLISITLSTLTVVPIFLFGRSLYNEKVAWFSALFYIILPDFLKYSIEVLREPVSWFFITFTLWLVWIGTKQNRSILLGIASLSVGLGAMTRVEGFIVWGALALFIAFQKSPGASLKNKVLQVTLFILLCPLLLSAILFFMKGHSGQTAFGEMTSFSINALIDNTRAFLHPGDPIARTAPIIYKSLPPIAKDALELANRHRVALAISEVIYKFIKSANLLIVLILLGLWKRKKEGFESSDWYLIYTMMALFGMSVFYTSQIYYFSTRHGLTLVLPSIFFAGHGLNLLAEPFSRGINRITPSWIMMKKYALHILTLFLITIFLSQGLAPRRTDKISFKEMGLWLKENGYQGSVIMGSKEFLRLVFYADGKFLEMPDSWEKVMGSIHQNGVRLVAVDSCSIEEECPGFNVNLSQAGLFPLKVSKGKGGKCSIQIYGVY
ncbi:MAG: hypothetical protein A2Y66_03350 [Nitrospirae bacterium RBG_13_41_22]|nr:MAG: hypothetical protein A2Y66_03350 [Nitrospirae bacterium RBG_13_41_22]